MTVFIASLFLPRTVRFNLQDPLAGSSSSGRSRAGAGQSGRQQLFHDFRDRQPSLFQGHSSITPPKTPNDDKELPGDDDRFTNEDGFRAQFPPASSGSASPMHAGPSSSHAAAKVTFEDDGSFAPMPADRPSPTWGGRADQPKSRASSPPPASLIDDKKALDLKAREMSRQGITQPRAAGRTESTDRVFARADWKVVRADHGNGGLRNAVAAAARDGRLDHHMWVGTLGMPTDALGEQRKDDIEARLATEYDMLTVFCSDDDINNHYSHFCKKILWPVFHYQMPDRPKNKAYEDNSWKDYVRVNQAFADVIIKNWKRGDSVWVHDYHLLLVPGMIRKKLPEAKIGFFLHVAFPSSELFRCLAVRRELLEGMLGANLVGFQIHEYARHFMQTCSRLLSAEAITEDRKLGLQLEDHYVDVVSSPIGIDPVSLNAHREEEAVAEWMTKMRNTYGNYKLIVARDKLDPLRGVRQKLLSYELFLNKNPEWRNRTVLIQVALSTSEKTELDATVSDIVTRVNSSWATLTYQPVVYLKQDIDYAQYLALLSLADALMITSQREGMNLTSHEYLSCQDGRHSEKRHGSLILSEFTGTSSLFGGNELLVNPWDYRACADAIKAALEMSPDEKERRWTSLHDIVNSHAGAEWFGGLCAELDRAYDHQASHDQTSVPRLSTTALVQQYRRASKRLLVLDYEGTLVNWGPLDKIIPVSPQRTLDVLNDLLLDDRNIIYVMSGRRPEELEQLFRQVPGLGLIAENGCFLREFSSSSGGGAKKPWIEMADMKEMRRLKESVKGMMQYFVDRTGGCEMEERRCSLLFHYRDADDPEHAARQASDCASNVNDAFETGALLSGPVQTEASGSGSLSGASGEQQGISHEMTSVSGGDGGASASVSGEINDTAHNQNQQIVHAVAEKGCIIVEPVKWTKTTAAEKVFGDLKANMQAQAEKDNHPIDFLMVVGDGREDEKVFKWANALADEGEVEDVVTVSLGNRNTEAKATLTQGVSGVLSALQRLAASSS